MKKITFWSLMAFVGLMLLTACNGQPQLRNVRGLVTNLDVKKDTLLNMTVFVTDKDSMVFNMDDVRMQSGMVMPGDSILVDYIEGKDGDFRALVVTLLPRPIKPSVLNHDTLFTAPIDSTSHEINKVPVKK